MTTQVNGSSNALIIQDATGNKATVTAGGLLNVAATFSANIPTTSAGQVLKNARGTGTGAAQTAATITSGKTGYLMAVNVTGSAGTNGLLNDNSDTALMTIGVPTGNGHTCVSAGGCPLAVYTSGQNIRVSFPATAIWSIVYVEQ